jgi:hypothetical protein
VKNSFKFLTIGLVLAVLLVSYATTNKPASAAPITGIAQDLVEWLDDGREVVKFYNASTTATFIIVDNDLETTPTGTATWTRVDTAVDSGGQFRVTDGWTTEASATNFVATNAAASKYALSAAGYATTSPSTTPFTASPAVTVDDASLLVDSANLTKGTFSLIADAVKGSTVVATFTHHIVDTYEKAAAGTTVATANNRAKVVSTSDSSGEWVTISEIESPFENEGPLTSLDADPDDRHFRGTIVLSNDPQATDLDDEEVWVQDGDTLTVTFYRSDHATVIDSTTATIDSTKPAITSVTPADGTIINSTVPSLSFSITDGGSGLSTSDPGVNVALFIVVGGGNECRVVDAELGFPSRTASQLDVNFAPVGTDKEWAVAPSPSCVGRTGGGFGIDTVALGANNHGVAFTWKIVATDVAGNSKTLQTTSLDLTVDTVKPDLFSATTGKGWDSVLNEDKTQLNSIKLVFSEGIDAATVAADGSDFTVAGQSVVGALVAGVDNTASAGPNDLNEFIYLQLAGDVSSNERPKVELTGSVSDKAGNALAPATGQTAADSIPNSTDGVKATVSDVVVASTLLASKGESKITWTADENITFTSVNLNSATDPQACTCISVSGGGTPTTILTTNKTGVVTTVSAAKAEGTFKQTAFTTTGIYGALIVTRDLAANQTVSGAVKVTSEDVSSQFDTTADALSSNTPKAIKLAKWPIADSDGDGTLADEFAIAINGTTVTSTVSAIDWSEAETVTMAFGSAIAAGDTVTVTYRYVTGAQAIEVDTAPPGISFDPADGSSTEDAPPFISIIFDDDEYAGDTNKTVTLTKATLTDPDGVTTDLLAMDDIGDGFGALATADNITYIYTSTSDLARGVYTVRASGTDLAGNTKSNVVSVFTVKGRATTKIALRPGWNLVSLPSDPASSAINDVVNVAAVDTVLAYDPTVAGGWMTAVRDADGNLGGPLATMDSSRAYWVHTTTFESLAIDIPGIAGGAQTLPPSIALVKGWNLVPVVSLDRAVTAIDPDQYFTGLSWSRVYSYNTATGKFAGIIPQAASAIDDGVRINTGKGYWVFLREAGDLVP